MTVLNGRPLVANSARGLGVRVDGGPYDDIAVQANGNVAPGTGGCQSPQSGAICQKFEFRVD